MSKQTTVSTDGLPEKTGSKPRLNWVVQEEFCGVLPFGQGEGAGKNLLHSGTNLSHRRAPGVAVRKGRGIAGKMIGRGNANGMVWFDGRLIYARGTGLYATEDGSLHVSLGVVTDTKKLFLHLNDRLYIYPDKLYLDKGGVLPGSLELDTGVVKSCLFDGKNLTLSEGATWSARGFAVGDCVKVVNADDDTPAPEGYYRIAALMGRRATMTRSFPANYESDARFLRTVPALEAGCVKDGRVFGSVGDRIHISAYGSGTDFYSPDTGSGEDPAIIPTGTEGDLTACMPWQGYVIFFKSDRILRLLGSRPDSFSLSDGGNVGIPKELADSLCEVDGSLYFLSDGGLYRYRGQEATRVVSFGEINCTHGMGGTDGVCYYVSVTQGNEKTLWIYSPERNSWYAEDDPDVKAFCQRGGLIWMQCGDGLLRVASSEGRDTGTALREEMASGLITGELVTAPMRPDFPEACRPVEAVIRASCAVGGELTVYAAYDGGEETVVGSFSGGMQERVLRIPLPIASVDSVVLRLSMEGEWVIHAIACGFAR